MEANAGWMTVGLLLGAVATAGLALMLAALAGDPNPVQVPSAGRRAGARATKPGGSPEAHRPLRVMPAGCEPRVITPA